MDYWSFLNYIEHSLSGTVADWYDSLNKEGKNVLRMMRTPTMLKNLCKEIQTGFIRTKLNFEEKVREW